MPCIGGDEAAQGVLGGGVVVVVQGSFALAEQRLGIGKRSRSGRQRRGEGGLHPRRGPWLSRGCDGGRDCLGGGAGVIGDGGVCCPRAGRGGRRGRARRWRNCCVVGRGEATAKQNRRVGGGE